MSNVEEVSAAGERTREFREVVGEDHVEEGAEEQDLTASPERDSHSQEIQRTVNRWRALGEGQEARVGRGGQGSQGRGRRARGRGGRPPQALRAERLIQVEPQVAQEENLASTQPLPLPAVEDLPGLEDAHSTYIPTLKYVPKSARGEFSRELARLWQDLGSDMSHTRLWVL